MTGQPTKEEKKFVYGCRAGEKYKIILAKIIKLKKQNRLHVLEERLGHLI